jgi:hypothetical protein
MALSVDVPGRGRLAGEKARADHGARIPLAQPRFQLSGILQGALYKLGDDALELAV